MSRLLVPILLVVAACSSRDARLDRLANAPLEPGRGLGDVRVGETTLREFVDRYGAGRVDVVAGDELGYELVFERGQMAFLFVLDDERRRSDSELLLAGQRRLPPFLDEHPSLGEMRLWSLTVAAGEDREASLYQGRVLDSAGLFDPSTDLMVKLGIPSEGSRPMLAGASPKREPCALLYLDDGLLISGDNEGELEPGAFRITRLTIFTPYDS